MKQKTKRRRDLETEHVDEERQGNSRRASRSLVRWRRYKETRHFGNKKVSAPLDSERLAA